ncbi:hypothetical protein KAR91_53940 [Candidatus Pacearchaeota archaeon]|nr:hypothetical protein [Candidatus Pacearchaeota archaeon]
MERMIRRSGERSGWEHSGTALTTAASEAVHIQPGFDSILVTLIAGAGTGSIEFTTSPTASVIADTAVWQTWSKGAAVTGTVSDRLLGSPTAVRCQSDSGGMTFEVTV